MIKIGDFSKLAHVTVKTLHHYGELGLLRPAHIDRYTGYRYYALTQLPRLNRIMALKDLGFSLEQITNLLDEKLSLEEMRGMLRMKKFELADRVNAEQARLSQVEMRLRQIEEEGQSPKYEIVLKDISSMLVLSTKSTITSKVAFLATRQKLQALLSSNLERARIKADGPWFSLLSEFPSVENKQSIELAVSVKLRCGQSAGDWAGAPVQLRELKAVPSMASTIYDGENASLGSSYANLFAWIKRNAYEMTGSYREIYLSEIGDSSQESEELSAFVELQCPVERAAIPLSVLSTQFSQKDKIMQPKFINKPRFTVVGFSYVGKNKNNEIPQLWGTFNQQANKIKNMIGECAYGACFSDIKWGEDGDFEYIACYEVSDASGLADNMVAREVPTYKYAVFTHRGKLDTLQDTYKYIYETWLPQSGLELVSPHFDMELYDDRFAFDSDKSEFDIYVAIEE
ncbi:MAG: MerR family transcriptional regulator [Chloroflexi bacterium]|nr:MerR family transcriptional regulator [Chloroflexota bacterium]